MSSVSSVAGNCSNGGLTGGIPNETTDYLYLANQVMEVRDPFGGGGSTDNSIRQYVWGTYPGAAALTRPSASTGFWQQNAGLGNLNIDECIELTTLATLGPQSLPPGTYCLLQDLLYRAVVLTNSSGSVVEAYDCDAYGNTLIFTGPGADGVWFTDDDVQSSYGANETIYCGYRFDPETDLYYVRNRSYNAALGRWLQRDPIGYAGGANLYEYVGGMASAAVDAVGLAGHGPPPLPFPNLFSASTLYSGSLKDVFGPNLPVSVSLKATLNSVSQFRPLWPVSSSNSNLQLQAVGVITLDGVSLTGTAGPTSGNKTLVKGEISTTIKASQGTLTPSFTLNITHMFLEGIADNSNFYQGWVNNGDGSAGMGEGPFREGAVGG